VDRWNKRIEKTGVSQRLFLPHKAFNRRIGTLSAVKVSPDGRVLSGEAQWGANVKEWLPTEAIAHSSLR
jgi:benzoyl-CoA 2,3-dioxygenase component B